jgi:hypothetical protein
LWDRKGILWTHEKKYSKIIESFYIEFCKNVQRRL